MPPGIVSRIRPRLCFAKTLADCGIARLSEAACAGTQPSLTGRGCERFHNCFELCFRIAEHRSPVRIETDIGRFECLLRTVYRCLELRINPRIGSTHSEAQSLGRVITDEGL